jgi:hypothetical protein
MNQQSPEKNSKIKRYALLILAMISLLGVGGCINNHSDRAEIAKDLLEKKYKEEFTIFTSGEGYGSLTGNTFKVVAAPTKNKSLKFEATVGNKGSWMVDQYNQALLEKEIRKVVSDNVSEISNQSLVNVHVGYTETNFTKDKISVDGYFKQNPNVPLVIRIIFDKDSMKNVGAEKEYEVLNELTLNHFPNRASLHLYYTNSKVFQECGKYFTQNAEVYQDFDAMMEGSKKIAIGVSKGQFSITSNEFVFQRKGDEIGSDQELVDA